MSATTSDTTIPPSAPPAFPERVRPAVGTVLVLCALSAAAIVLLFAGAMTRPANYDEDQYLTAGLMVANGLLPYRDFAYLQAPLYPFVLGALFKLTGGWYLLSGRVLTFLFAVASGGMLWLLVRRLGAGRWLSAVLLAACMTSPFLALPLSNTRNDALPLTLMLAGLCVHLWSVERSWWGRAGAALLLGLAVEAKVTYLFGPIALGIHALFAPRERLVPYVLGSLIALLPALVCLYAAPEAFRFGVFDYHMSAPEDFYGRQGLGELLTAPARLDALLDWLFLGGNLTLLVPAVALSIVTMARRRKWKRPGRLLFGLFVGAVVMAFVPTPPWPMYYAPVAPLLAMCIAHLDRITVNLADPNRKRILYAVAALPMVPILLLNARDVARAAELDRWVGVEAHRSAAAIRALLPSGGPVATLFPHSVMDANPVPVAFATGPFVFRSGALYSPPLLARLHALSPATLDAAFDRDPPAAILAGLYPKSWRLPMDAPLASYAERHGWKLVRTDADGARLWLRP